MGGALRDTHRGAVQPLEVFDAGVMPDHKTLAVIKIDRTLAQPERHAAQIGLGRIAVEHVDLARLERGEAVLRG